MFFWEEVKKELGFCNGKSVIRVRVSSWNTVLSLLCLGLGSGA